jgi:transposase
MDEVSSHVRLDPPIAYRQGRLKDRSTSSSNPMMEDAMGRRRGYCIHRRCEPMERPMQKLNDLSRSLITLEPASTLIAVIEMSLSSWLVAGIVPGLERQPLKKLAVDESALLKLLHRWREEAEKAGRRVERIVVAFEAGRDGFWLARWLKARSIEAHVIHPASVAVSREHRRAKTDRLDTELLKRAFLGWLRGERDHCKVVAIPTLKAEDAKRPNRERENLVGEQSRLINRMKAALIRLGIRGFNPKLKRAAGRLDSLRTPEGEPIPPNTLAELRRDMERRRLVSNQIRQIEQARLEHFEQTPNDEPHAMVRLLARVIGVGIETADMLVHEVLSRNMRDRRAIARYAGLTGSPDESGRKRREKGLARSGNGRVRRGMVQLAWRFLTYQKQSALAQWYRARTENARGARKSMIVALARKLLIALWRLVRQGVVPDGVVLRPAQ